MDRITQKKRLEEIIALAGAMRYELLVEEAKEAYAPKLQGSHSVNPPVVDTVMVGTPVGETCDIDPTDRCEKCNKRPWQVVVGPDKLCLTCMTNL